MNYFLAQRTVSGFWNQICELRRWRKPSRLV